MKANGVRGIVGRSFARIFYRNCMNLALAAVACPDAVDTAHDGSAIAIDPSGAVVVDGRRFPVPAAPALLTELAEAGGLVAWTERELEAG
jgi:3-isopropylmalate/(R)-2-methylmalate dehydratase small subunit